MIEEKKLTDEEVKEIISLYIAEYEEYKKYGSVVAKVSPQFIIKLIHQLQDKNEKVVQDYYCANQTCEEQREILKQKKTEIERLTLAVEGLTSENKVLHKENTNVISLNDALYREKKELQKQVNELKEERDVFKNLFEHCNNSSITIDQIIESMNSFYREQAEHLAELKIEQAVKDTAKKILQYVGDLYDDGDQRFQLKDYQWHKNLCKKYGVEVE